MTILDKLLNDIKHLHSLIQQNNIADKTYRLPFDSDIHIGRVYQYLFSEFFLNSQG